MKRRRVYIGNCVNSFDEDGDCVIDSLGYYDVSDFGVGDERAETLSWDEFDREVFVSLEMEEIIEGHEVIYLLDRERDLYMLYDSDDDIHYFFR